MLSSHLLLLQKSPVFSPLLVVPVSRCCYGSISPTSRRGILVGRNINDKGNPWMCGRDQKQYHSSSASLLPLSTSENGDLTNRVQFLKLNDLRDNAGATPRARRIGRGIGCSKGKTSGRGHKGQKSRSGGKIPAYFEGGQTPLYKRLPARGMNRSSPLVVAFNLGTLQDYLNMGRFPPGVGLDQNDPITLKHLMGAGILKANTTWKRGGVKLLAKGKERLTHAVHLELGWASLEAIRRVEELGGSVTTVHYNPLALRQILKGDKWSHRPQYREARPPPKYQPYYTSWNHRGYLHPAVQLRKWFLKEETPAATGGNPNPNRDLMAKFDVIRSQLQQ